MKLFSILALLKAIQKLIGKPDMQTSFKILQLNLPVNPNYSKNRPWGKRSESDISKIIVHQELGNGTTEQVHRYHISPESHIKPGLGAPKIAYHFTIEKDGTIYQVNELSDITWHCSGQNLISVGIMLVGNYDGPSHTGSDREPPKIQLDALKFLLFELLQRLKLNEDNVFVHANFGKVNCPGIAVTKFVTEFRSGLYSENRI